MIETLEKICRPKVKNRQIPLDYLDDIGDGFVEYTNYGKAVFKTKVDWKAHTWNDIITYNNAEEWKN